MSKQHVTATCPYCGHDQRVLQDELGCPRLQLVICCVEDGGCDEEYAIKFSVVVTGQVFKIDGQGR